MREYEEDPQRYAWIVYAVSALLIGGLGGYVIAVAGPRPGAAPAPVSSTTAAAAPMVDQAALQAYRDILARDPKNLQAAVAAANLLYDARRYLEAIPLYQQAFALNPSDVNVSTDLGTALWYAGRADEALAQYDRSLTIAPAHAQTLYNAGLVRAEGKHDYRGAVAMWEQLLQTSPAYPNAAAVRELLADAKLKSNPITQ